jgi:hypothetical protein
MKPVIVMTAMKGVFFGYTDEEPSPEKMTLKNVRMCVRWRNLRGVLGLAETGPVDGCLVSVPAPEATIYQITAVVAVTDEAVKAWEAAPWG